MPKIKKIKIFTHPSIFFSVPSKTPQTGQNKLGALVVFFLRLIYNICLAVGNFLIALMLYPARSVKKEIENTKASLKKRLNIVFQKKFYKSVLIFVIVCSVGAVAFGSAHFVQLGIEFKNKILNLASKGTDNLTEAKQALQDQNFREADAKFLLAYQNFQNGQQELDSSGKFLSSLLSIFPQKRDAEKLLSAAGSLSQAGTEAISFYQTASELKINSQGISSKDNQNSRAFQNLNSTLSKIQNNISSAQNQLSGISLSSVPKEKQQIFLDLQNKITVLNRSFGNLNELFSLLENLVSGRKKIFIIFENNNELRAGGGFPGTFGRLEVSDGVINSLDISSIYDLDGQLKEKIIPPSPILNVNDRWFLRDSTWFANFPDSAKKVSEFYEKEGGSTQDLIIALTPRLILDLLKITGPINLAKYNISLDSENFVEQTQFVSTISQGPENKPKQILADLVPVLIQKLSALKSSELPLILAALQDNLNSKQIIFYSRDPNLQNQLSSFHWTGEILPTDRDFISVVSSNLGGTKTDLYINQNIKLSSVIGPEGDIINELAITRTNTLPVLEQSFNQSFIRVLVPEGSELLTNTGFDTYPLTDKNFGGYTIDPQVEAWEKSSVQDALTGTIIGSEAGKTFFGNWLKLQGGETKTVRLTYRLPFKLSALDRLSLLVQKQAGSQGEKFNYNLQFANKTIEWKNFEATNIGKNSLGAETTLDKDFFWGLVLKNKNLYEK